MPDLPFRYCPLCATALVERVIAGAPRAACPACEFTQFRGPRAVALVVLHHEGQLLLGRRTIEPGKGLWNFCGGYIEHGEPAEAAAIREAKEEANLDVTLDRLIGVYSADAESHVIIAYQASLTRHQISQIAPQREEVSELALFPWEALPPLAFPVHHEILRDWKQLNS